jgi:hypothetical protein
VRVRCLVCFTLPAREAEESEKENENRAASETDQSGVWRKAQVRCAVTSAFKARPGCEFGTVG